MSDKCISYVSVIMKNTFLTTQIQTILKIFITIFVRKTYNLYKISL